MLELKCKEFVVEFKRNVIIGGKLMKKVKILTVGFVSILGILLLPKGINAASVDMAYEIQPGEKVNTYSITKTIVGPQSVKVTYAYTALTDPCPKCEFYFYGNSVENGAAGGRLTLQMNEDAEFRGDTMFNEGKYYLSIERKDFTLLPTTVLFKWIYQK